MIRKKQVKANGIHYTPSSLAAFLARAIVTSLPAAGCVHVLDPACGDGALLRAFTEVMPKPAQHKLRLVGYETDGAALEQARRMLEFSGVESVTLCHEDFLMLDRFQNAPGLFRSEDHDSRLFDVVIANPPYVRTQVMGATRSQSLARRFGLTGRVDLYHAFTMAMRAVLTPGGTLGLLTSNRFLTTNSGAALRKVLRTTFDLETIVDLGDTKLFAAAVLPVIVVARKRTSGQMKATCRFDRVYEYRKGPAPSKAETRETILEAVADPSLSGVVRTTEGTVLIERGTLSAARSDEVWTLSTPRSDRWLQTVNSHRSGEFQDAARIRVGIKTTADEVFIREDFRHIPIERGLIRPLITHRDAGRWVAKHPGGSKMVLYPHELVDGKRRPVLLERHPQLKQYLARHAERLKRRKYVTRSGREWYEIWVPHNPSDWAKPKIVFPDIAETPRFFLDHTGAVVNGDCYWITLRDGEDPSLLLLMLAVANSTFITRYYDIAFHNKLYSGRRRFMTQYVKRFPLPITSASASREIVRQVQRALRQEAVTLADEDVLDNLVWEAFGLVKEA